MGTNSSLQENQQRALLASRAHALLSVSDAALQPLPATTPYVWEVEQGPGINNWDFQLPVMIAEGER